MFLTVRPRRALTAALFLLPVLLLLTALRPAAAAAPVVYLTFDDGPSRNTDPLLDALAELGVPATFFVTMQQPEWFPACRRAHEEGHLIAAHTASHKLSEIYSSPEAFWRDIDRVNDMIAAATGAPSSILRFAGGSSNTVSRRYGGAGLMETLVRQCGERGFVYHDWNVDTRDAISSSTAEQIARRALEGARGKQVVVLLMHDGAAQTTVADAVRIIVPALQQQGFRFDTLDHLSTPIHHSF